MRVVSDTSVLIALDNIGRLELIRKLFNEIYIPESVAREYGEQLPQWIKIVRVEADALVRALEEFLHRGEAEAISLAIQIKADLLLLDDKKARAIASRLGLKVLGTLGILILARKKDLIESLEEEIARLLERSFWISQTVIGEALEKARHDC